MKVIKAKTFDYGHGQAIIQQIKPTGKKECWAVVRRWKAPGEPSYPQSWWNIPGDISWDGMAERCFESFLRDEQRCWDSWKGKVGA